MFGEVQRARERDHKHEEERDHGHGEEGVQTPAAGARGGRLALNICGRGHLEKQRVNKVIYTSTAGAALLDGRHHELL